MLHLYYKPTCPFCQRVLTANESIGAPLTLLDISSDEILRAALITKGGKVQVPFLVDEKRGMMLYESADIIDYLAEHYQSSNDSAGSPATYDRGDKEKAEAETEADAGADGGGGGGE